MSHGLSTHALPSTYAGSLASQAAIKANATAGSGTTSGASTTSSTDPTGLNSTFLNLLVQELQNQDPTDPMDSNAMVGQMISLNQLNQLVNIDQLLGGSSSASPESTKANASQTQATQPAAGAGSLLPATAGATGSSATGTTPTSSSDYMSMLSSAAASATQLGTSAGTLAAQTNPYSSISQPLASALSTTLH